MFCKICCFHWCALPLKVLCPQVDNTGIWRKFQLHCLTFKAFLGLIPACLSGFISPAIPAYTYASVILNYSQFRQHISLPLVSPPSAQKWETSRLPQPVLISSRCSCFLSTSPHNNLCEDRNWIFRYTLKVFSNLEKEIWSQRKRQFYWIIEISKLPSNLILSFTEYNCLYRIPCSDMPSLWLFSCS